MSEKEDQPCTSHTYSYNEFNEITQCEKCGIEPIWEEWDLGDDYYCDTCGGTNNRVVFEEWDEGEYQLYMGVGCYGGETYRLDNINELIKDISGYEHFSPEMESDIRNTTDKFKEKLGIQES